MLLGFLHRYLVGANTDLIVENVKAGMASIARHTKQIQPLPRLATPYTI